MTGSRTASSCFALLSVVVLAVLSGCAAPGRLNAVPPSKTTKAEIPGIPGVRYVLPEGVDALLADAKQSLIAERNARHLAGQAGPLPPAEFLAISGGGDNGAFGAGVLCGWTAAGNRPDFKLVTGISTGALIAPLAFLGRKYDGALRSLYTETKPGDVLERRSLLAAIFDDALADNRPLRGLISRTITAEVMREIALEGQKGRILLVATTDLDARRPVIWNMTKIAASGDPKALQLFHEVLAASAAIPGAFPPTMFDVDSEGKRYQEMHVDGGAFSQVFVYPASIQLQEEGAAYDVHRDRTLYVIRNSKIEPDWSEVERRTLSIAQRAIVSLIQTQGVGDLYRIYAIAHRDGVDFNLAYIPDDFDVPHPQEFDTAYMRALFDVGYARAVRNHPWLKVPPGM